MGKEGYFCPTCRLFKTLKEVDTAGRCKDCETYCVHPMDSGVHEAEDDFYFGCEEEEE